MAAVAEVEVASILTSEPLGAAELIPMAAITRPSGAELRLLEEVSAAATHRMMHFEPPPHTLYFSILHTLYLSASRIPLYLVCATGTGEESWD
jgi:hypothetical protein